MASSGNGTFIPMVSSSPPPMDDGAFDDDDDEFGSFSSASFGHDLDSPPGKWTKPKKDNTFTPIRDDPPEPFQSADDRSPTKGTDGLGNFSAFNKSFNSNAKFNSHADITPPVLNNNIDNSTVNGDDDDDDDEFADFASFETDKSVDVDKHKLSGDSKRRVTGQPLNENNSHEKLQTLHLDDLDTQSTLSGVSNIQSLNKNSDSTIKTKECNKEGVHEVKSSDDFHLPHKDSRNDIHKDKTVSNYGSEDSECLDFQKDGSDRAQLSLGKVDAPMAKSVNRTFDDDDESPSKPSGPSKKMGMPTVGSFSFSQDSDRQTFDSGIESIMTPSDSSPEVRDDLSSKTVNGQDADSGFTTKDASPNSRDQDWGDFGAFPPSRQSFQSDHIPATTSVKRTHSRDDESHEARVEFKQDDDDFGDFGSFHQPETKSITEVKRIPKPDVLDLPGSGIASIQRKDSGFDSDVLPKTRTEPSGVDKSDDKFSDAPEAEEDDFGDFESMQRSENISTKVKSSQDESGDDWSGFSTGKAAAAAAPAPAASSSQGASDEFGDFGNFSSFSSSQSSSKWPQSSKKDHKESEDFGSFGSFSTSSPSSSHTQFGSASPTIPTKVSVGDKVERVFHSSFPVSMVIGGARGSLPTSVDVLQEMVSSNDDRTPSSGGTSSMTSNNKQGTRSSNKQAVWTSLSDMENTLAQKYQWNNSRHSRKLLKSLGIDSRNILASVKGSVPIFATGLGMLTPSKPGEKAERVPPTGDCGSGTEETAPSGIPATEGPVPKVEFDWSSSGLINPLDAQKLDPELLDLEVTSSDPPLKPSSSFGQSLSSSTSSQKTTTPLDEILKHSSTSMVQQRPKREPGLSTESNAVLDSMPDLSFMLAKVLMFPVSSPTKADQGGASMTWAGSVS